MDEERRAPVGAAVPVAPVPKRVSWAAVFAGAVLAAVIALALELLGLGVSISSATHGGGATAAAVRTGTAIWAVAACLVALFVGGWAAARLSGSARRLDGVLHGLITWALVTLTMVFLLSSTLAAVMATLVGAVPSTAATDPGDDTPFEGDQLVPAPRAGDDVPPAVHPDTAAVAGPVSIITAVALLLGGIVAGIGGAAGSRSRDRSPTRASSGS